MSDWKAFVPTPITTRLLTTPIGRRLPPRQWRILGILAVSLAVAFASAQLATWVRAQPAASLQPRITYIVITATPAPPRPTATPPPTPLPAVVVRTVEVPVYVEVQAAPATAPPPEESAAAADWHPPLSSHERPNDNAGPCGGPDARPPLCH